ncbi:IS66 family transposase [Curvibacter sp. AEP1-3]|uniref:IS66 family transposase n=1 Tax=Curvibacter sp. AEP1-3 TaxID=1844971 RepID=UPI0012F8F55D|nr:IS66 family transposase [Curvibacter sp. AEP1-3]
MARIAQVEPEFATRFIQRTFAEGAELFGPADPVELDGWTDTASGLGGPIFDVVDGKIFPILDPEPVVELSAGRGPDEAILDLHTYCSMKRIVLRKAGDVGSIIFTSIEVLAKQIAGEKRAREQAEAECARLAEQLKLAQERQFGTSSEQKLQVSSPGAEADSPPVISDDAEPKKKLRLAASGGGRKPLAAHLPREDVRHELQPHERKCQACNGELIELSPTVAEEMYTIPKRHVVRRHAQANYHCRCCNRFTSAPMPLRMFAGSSYGSPEFVADVATAKYQFGIPLYRQVDMAAASGVPLNRTTLANLMITLGDRLTSLHILLREKLLSQPLIHADETTVQVLKEPGRRPEQQSYLWLFRSGAKAEQQMVVFEYQQTRAGIHALNFLTQDDGSMYSGKLQADGYAGYNSVSEAVRIACMAHIRRKFVDALKLVPSPARSDSVAAEIIELIGELYAVERSGKGLTDEALLALRNRDSRPLVARIEAWLKEHRNTVLPKTALGNAVRYALDQWPAMKKYLDDPGCSIDNNIAERDIKRVVMGRKAWLFAESVDGMEANAVLYSLVQTCIANQVDPYRYFKAVIERMPYAKSQTDLEALLPWALKQEFEDEAAAVKLVA